MTNTTPLDTEIVSAKIHPAIGVARVGNSESGSFIGPEIPNPPPALPGDRRDSAHALKRQAARFRVYGYNRAGEVVAELTADRAQIAWTVEMANLKAAWYQFQIALDIPEAATADPSVLRNRNVKDRAILEIESLPQTLKGANAAVAKFEGKFNSQPVYLGEASTDKDGRLTVLGGHGKTGSLPGAQITTFANNDGWHDDVSDGPVTAKVTIGGKDIPTDPAWIVVAPPNYAPDLKGIRTIYDLMVDVFIDSGALPMPGTPSFTHDILPIFERLAGLQWVNAGYAVAFGYAGTLDLMSAPMIARLGDASAANKGFRYQILNSFRDFEKDSWSPEPLPWLYGDAVEIRPFGHSPRQNTMIAKHQLFNLQRWAEGNFTFDYPAARERWTKIEEVPVARQPAVLDRAALEFCLADAFHPGCEMTWPVRHASMYMAPFRLRHRRADETVPLVGNGLTPAAALAFNGPLYGQRAGWITRWMAVPWHTDTASCRSQASYDRTYNPFVPTFWPARVPNQVLSLEGYNTVMNAGETHEKRVAAFHNRIDWFNQELDAPQIVKMLAQFGNLSLVEARKGVDGDPQIPPTIYVGDGLPKPPVVVEAAAALRETPRAEFTEHLGNFPVPGLHT